LVLFVVFSVSLVVFSAVFSGALVVGSAEVVAFVVVGGVMLLTAGLLVWAGSLHPMAKPKEAKATTENSFFTVVRPLLKVVTNRSPSDPMTGGVTQHDALLPDLFPDYFQSSFRQGTSFANEKKNSS
jgi:hypothetical protein